MGTFRRFRPLVLTATLCVTALCGCDEAADDENANFASPAIEPADCGYLPNDEDTSQGTLPPVVRARRDRRQPAAVATNENGQSVCAYVLDVCSSATGDCDSFPDLLGSPKTLNVARDGAIEIAFESAVSDVEPIFPDACGPAGDATSVGDGVSWRFVLPPDLFAADCFHDAFSVATTYAPSGRFESYRVDYGISIDVEGEPDQVAEEPDLTALASTPEATIEALFRAALIRDGRTACALVTRRGRALIDSPSIRGAGNKACVENVETFSDADIDVELVSARTVSESQRAASVEVELESDGETERTTVELVKVDEHWLADEEEGVEIR